MKSSRSQGQIWNISQKVSSRGVQFTSEILAWCGKQYSSWNTYFAKGDRIPILSLNELGQMSVTTIIFSNFVNN